MAPGERIHRMAVPPDVWPMKVQGLLEPGASPERGTRLNCTMRVQDSSHTTPGAFGYMLSQMRWLPRLVVPTHFITADDAVNCALGSVQAHVPTIGRLGAHGPSAKGLLCRQPQNRQAHFPLKAGCRGQRSNPDDKVGTP
jgi:hypothetical protein